MSSCKQEERIVELQNYIKNNLSGVDMSPTTALLIQELAVPVLLELLSRQGNPKATINAIYIAKDPKIAFETMSVDDKDSVVRAIADILSGILDTLVRKK